MVFLPHWLHFSLFHISSFSSCPPNCSESQAAEKSLLQLSPSGALNQFHGFKIPYLCSTPKFLSLARNFPLNSRAIYSYPLGCLICIAKSACPKLNSWVTTPSCLPICSSHSLPSSCSAPKPCSYALLLHFLHPHITSISTSVGASLKKST
jgi:hypothetical protein